MQVKHSQRRMRATSTAFSQRRVLVSRAPLVGRPVVTGRYLEGGVIGPARLTGTVQDPRSDSLDPPFTVYF
jgi:hypothetical protein